VKDYYHLLGISPSASIDEVKRAFRHQIARYHPDKVQHLGREFQDLAAERAAELTEAYNVLSHEAQRAEYDGLREKDPERGTPVPAPGAQSAAASAGRRPVPAEPELNLPRSAESPPPHGRAFSAEQARRDLFVRAATIERFRDGIAQIPGGRYSESDVGGFDFAYVPRATLFGRVKQPRLAGWVVPRVDRDSMARAWAEARRWTAEAPEGACVFLIGSNLAPRRELEEAVAQERRKPLGRGPVTLIPIDARTWDAYVPVDAPAVARSVMERLRGR
jgi:curved DNA-binding protein CbpA